MSGIPPDETDGLEEDDLPGLDDRPSRAEPDVPTEQAGTDVPGPDGMAIDALQEARDLAEAAIDPKVSELDTWFEEVFGGETQLTNISYSWILGESASPFEDYPDLNAWTMACRTEPGNDPWGPLSDEVKTRIRIEWEQWQASVAVPESDPDAAAGDLSHHTLGAPYPPEHFSGPEAAETPSDDVEDVDDLSPPYEDEDSHKNLDIERLAVPGDDPEQPHDAGGFEEHDLPGLDDDYSKLKVTLNRRYSKGFGLNANYTWGKAKEAVRNPRVVAGAIGVIGLVLLSVFVFGGSDEPDDAAVAVPSVAPVAEATTPPSTEPVVAATEAPAVALDAPEAPAAPFPNLWLFTATKTADLVLIPDFMETGAVGIQLDLYVMVTETCTGGTCTYTSVVEPLDRFTPLVGTVPEATWVVDGLKWSLDAMWQADPDFVQDHHYTYEFTVTDTQLIDGRTVPAAFTGTWTQASSGPDAGGGWEHVAEWSVVGTAVSG